jgi:hypothetical protein
MFRPLVFGSLLAIVGFVAWPWSAATAPTPGEKADTSLAGKLDKTVKFNGFDDPKLTLLEVLDNLAKRHDLAFDINEAAFKAGGLQDVGKSEIVGTPIPALNDVRLSTVLRKILNRVPAESGAVYLVRRDVIEITTGAFLEAEIFGQASQGPRLPLVHANLDKKPLDEALKELADQADFNVLLDNRAAEMAKTPVSGKFTNTPLDTAVRLLADMADLRHVHLDNVLYVTTKENAAALETRLEKEKNKEGDEPAPRMRKGGTRGVLPQVGAGAS